MAGEKDNHITRVLFCGPHFDSAFNYTREYLQDYPFIQVDEVAVDDVPNVISKYHICVPKLVRFDSSLTSRATQAKLILQFGVGLEGVDIDAATRCGIKVGRIPGINAASCAEMAIYLMLGLLRKQNELLISVKQKKIGDPIGQTLEGKTVFILGCGSIGMELAKRLQPFGVKIIATKRSWTSNVPGLPGQNNVIDDIVNEKGSQEDIYKFASKADLVVCCLSLNKETAGIVNKSFLSSMRKGSFLINIARGGVLEYDAVLQHLKCGHLGGLGMDVAWTEPFDPDDQILKLDNVIFTPHVAGITEHAYKYMAKVLGDVTIQLHSGAPWTGIELVN